MLIEIRGLVQTELRCEDLSKGVVCQSVTMEVRAGGQELRSGKGGDLARD